MNGSTTDFNGNIVINGSRAITLEENCPLDVCPSPGQLPPRIIAPRGKLPPKKISPSPYCTAPTQANSHQRVSQVNWGKQCIVYNIRVLQLRSKKWFASIYFLQILNKLCRTPLIREHLSLNASWFSYARTQKENTIFWKNWFEKNNNKKQKNFIVNNNKKIIGAWYLRQAPG